MFCPMTFDPKWQPVMCANCTGVNRVLITILPLKESIWIRRQGKHIMNKDEGAYRLHNIYSTLVTHSTYVSDRYKEVTNTSDELPV